MDSDESSLNLTFMSSEKTDSDEDEMRATSSLCNTWADYTNSSSLHGVPYIRAPNRCDRVLWLAIVLVALVSAIYGSVTAYNDWQNQPILTSLETTGNINQCFVCL